MRLSLRVDSREPKRHLGCLRDFSKREPDDLVGVLRAGSGQSMGEWAKACGEGQLASGLNEARTGYPWVDALPKELSSPPTTRSRGEMARVTEANDLAVMEVVVLAEHCDASGGGPEADVAE